MQGDGDDDDGDGGEDDDEDKNGYVDDVDGGNSSDDGDVDGDGEDEIVTDSSTLHRKPRIILGKLPRGSDAVYEFENNELNVMTIFRHLFPLMYSKTICKVSVFSSILFRSLPLFLLLHYVSVFLFLSDGKRKLVFGPLKAKGTISEKQRVYIMKQFTTLAARDPMLHHFLANQTRRHVTCSIVSRLPKNMSSKFEQLVNADNFAGRRQDARRDPTSPDARALNRKVRSL